jgi:hypothetical protein
MEVNFKFPFLSPVRSTATPPVAAILNNFGMKSLDSKHSFPLYLNYTWSCQTGLRWLWKSTVTECEEWPSIPACTGRAGMDLPSPAPQTRGSAVPCLPWVQRKGIIPPPTLNETPKTARPTEASTANSALQIPSLKKVCNQDVLWV